MKTFLLVLHAGYASSFSHGYVNNYPEEDNPFGIELPPVSVRANSFAFLVADFCSE